MFDGFILRKPRVSSSASPFTAAPDVVVLDGDRTEYLTEYVGPENPPNEEFLVVPASTSNLIVSKEEQEEQLTTAINDEGTLFQFNENGFAVRDVTVTPTPDYLNVDAGIIRYDSAPGTVTVSYFFDPISLWYSKNGETTRFDFDTANDRWRPLPGSAPDFLGTMPEDGIVELATVEHPRDHRIVLGHPSAGQEVVLDETDWEEEFDPAQEPGPGDVAAFLDTGEVWFGSDFIEDHFGGPIYQFRKDFFGFDASTGQLGSVGDELFLNPIPEQGNRPLIRVEYGTHLPVKTGTSSSDIDADHPVVWDESTGQVFVDDALFSEGSSVYYDGVYVNDEPIYSPEPTGGEIDVISEVSFLSSEVSFTTDIDPEVMILFLPETGLMFEEIEVVDDLDDFLRSFELPDQRAQVHVDGSDLTVRLPHSFANQHSGKELAVTTGDFPLENGITFRMFRSPVNLTGERDLPDATDRVRVVDEEIIDSVRPGTLASVVQIPLQNIGGYGENIFFRLQDGPRRRFLTPEEDVVYDFDNDRLLWTEQSETVTDITSPTPSIKLDHEVLYDANFVFELNEGDGFEELIPSEDILVDFDSGELSFSDLRGRTIYEGVGRIDSVGTSEFEVRTLDLDETDFDFPVQDDRHLPLLIFEDRNEVYKVIAVDEASNTITVHTDFEFEQDAVSFELIEAPEVVFEHSLRTLTLNRRWLFPKKISPIEDKGFVPDGESFSFRDDDGSSLDHETLSPETLGTLREHDENALELPDYFLESGSNFSVFRDSKELVGPVSNPDPDEFGLNSGGAFEFNQDDIDNHPDAAIVLDPKLSDSNHGHDNLIEVLHENRQVGIHDDLSGEDLFVSVQLYQDQYTVQPRNGVLFFNTSFRTNDRLEVDYFTDEETQVTEVLGFKTTETLDVSAGDDSSVFASGAEVHPDRPVQVLVNGAPVDSSFSIDGAVATVFFDSVSANRVVQAQYQQLTANGGERIAQLSRPPFFPPVDLEEGAEQMFYGNHLDVLDEDVILLFDDEAYVIQSVSYDANDDVTRAELYPPVREARTTEAIFGTTATVEKEGPLLFDVENNSEDEQEITVSGDVSSQVDPFDVLYLDDAPHFVSAVQFDEDAGVTLIQFRNILLREFDSPSVHLSKQSVYSPDTETLLTDSLAFAATQPHKLIRFDDSDSQGHLLDPESEYEFLDAGSIVLDPTNVDLPGPDERWFMAYMARREVGPKVFKGRRIVPQFRSQYTRFINASTDNGIEGSALVATYSYSSPDTFYFRALGLDQFRGEVEENLSSGAEGLSAGSGTTASFGGSQELYERGENTLVWTEGHLYDQDRVARRFIDFYNTTAQLLESYLQAVDGRIVGDRDGQFRFHVEDATNLPSPGQTDPITGKIRPYYVTPEGDGLPIWKDAQGNRLSAGDASELIEEVNIYDQEGNVRNAMDDIVMVSKKPFRLNFPSVFVYEGTFREMWRPHRLSRLYPQRSNVATVTPPPVPDGGGSSSEYSFIRDFGQTLGDLNQDDVMSVERVTSRPSRAWLIDDEVVSDADGIRLSAGMVFPLGDSAASNDSSFGTLEEGEASRLIPGFEVGTIVHLGRSTITRDDSTGLITRTTDTYATNMKISKVEGDHIWLETLGLSDLKELFIFDFDSWIDQQDNVTDITDFMDITNPADLGDTIEVRKNDTIFVQSLDEFGGSDFGLDGSEGELVNRTLPSFLAAVVGQTPPDPKTPLDAVISYKNQRTEPFRFPALDGEPVDDDGLMAIPYLHPLAHSEAAFTGVERSVLQEIFDQTVPGLNAEADIVEPYALQFTGITDLSDPENNPAYISPKRYDSVFIEGEVDGFGDSIEYRVSEVDEDLLFLATYDVEEVNVPYVIEDVVTGTGQRDDPPNDDVWFDDTGRDFSNLDLAVGTVNAFLEIGTSTYQIAEFANGFIRTTTAISETGPESFQVNLEGVGDIAGDIHTFEDSAVGDFGEFSLAGLTLELDGNFNTGSFTIVHGDGPEIFVQTDPALSVVGQNRGTAILNNPILVEGSGERLTDQALWQDLDPLTSFEDFEGIDSLYLHVIEKNNDDVIVGVSSYQLLEIVSADVVRVDGSIDEIDGEYVLTISESYAQGHGAVVVDDPPAGENFLFEKANNRLYVNVADPEQVFNIAEGHRLIISSDQTNGSHYRVEGFGVYDGVHHYIEVSPDFRATATESDDTDPASLNDAVLYPVRWYSYRPRRLDPVLGELEDAFFQRWVLYQSPEDAPTGPNRDIRAELIAGGYTSENPSTPSLDVLEDLVEVVFGEPEAEASDGIVSETTPGSGEWQLESPSLTSGTSADGPASYVLIDFDASANEPSPARGFFRVEALDDPLNPSTITLKEGSQPFYDDNTAGWIDRIDTDTDVEFRVYTVDEFTERTYELILYEYYNVLTILQRLHAGLESVEHQTGNFIDAFDAVFGEFPGDPTNEVVANHLFGQYISIPVGVLDRQEWVRGKRSWTREDPNDPSETIEEGDPVVSVVNEIEAILKGREALYDLRFSWIDFRVNLEDGTLPSIDRFEARKTKEKQKIRKNLLKLL